MSTQGNPADQEARIDVKVDLFEEQGRIIARWPQMKLSAHGNSRKEAMDNLANMVIACLHVSIERGDLAQMLKTAGIEIGPSLPGAPAPRADEVKRMPHLVIQENVDSRAAA